MKGQASLEFLTTYSWIIIGVLVAIGVLAYLGYLSPDRFLPEECKLTNQIICDEIQLTNTELKIMIKNTLNQDINITNVNHAESGITCPIIKIPKGRINEISCTGDFSKYDNTPLRLNMTFKRTNGTIEHNFLTNIVVKQ